MAKGTKKFSKSSITVRAILLPAGDAPITGNVESMISAMTESMNTGMSSFYLGNGMFGKDANTFITKSKTNKKSLLGDKESIYALLADIKSQMLSEKQNNEIISHLKKQTKIISNGMLLDESIPFLSLINQQLSNMAEALLQTKENKVSSKDNDELLKQINLSISDQITEPFDNINKQLSTIISSYIETIQNYDADNKEKLKLLEETKEAKIRILLEGLESSTIQDLIEFTHQNTDNLVSNLDNVQKFFDSLKVIQDLKLNDTIASITNLEPLLDNISQLLKKTDKLSDIFNEQSINTIINIFGDRNNQGAFKTIIQALNSLPELKDQNQEKIQSSLENLASIMTLMSTLLGDTLKDLKKMDKMAISIFNINPDFVFGQIERIFGTIKEKSSAVNKVDSKLGRIIRCINSLDDIKEEKVKAVGKSIVAISEVFGMTFLMYSIAFPLALAYKKVFSKADFSMIFNDLQNIFTIVNNVNQIDNGKTDQIVTDLKNLRKTIKNISLLALESKIILSLISSKDEKNKFPYINRIQDLIDTISTVFWYIRQNENIKYITDKTKTIDTNIKALSKTLLNIQLLGALGFASKFNPFKSLKSIQNLFDQNYTDKTNIHSLFKAINDSKIDVNIEPILNNIKSVETIISTINKLKLNKGIQKRIDDIWKLFVLQDQGKKFGKFGPSSRSLGTSLPFLFEAINKFQNDPKVQDIKKAEDCIKSLSGIIIALNEIGKQKNIKKIQKNIDLYFEVLEEYYKNVDEKFDRIIQTSAKADQIKDANKKISEGLDDCTETAVKTSCESKDVNKGLMTLEGLTEFMISAAVVMSIGALFMMLSGGKFAAAALEFGVTLMAFEMLVITPILLFRNIQKDAIQSLQGLSSFIITCTIVISIGALFISLGGGKFVKNALAFGIILSIFEMLIVAPFLAFVNHKTNVMNGLKEFSTFLITTTIIMSVGALFMSLGGGKFAKNALMFGVVLGLFELLVVSPFILFGAMKSEIFDSADKFISLLITCTTILLIGALFMSIKNGALVKNGLKFAATLMLFEMMVIAPFLLMNLFKDQVFNGMKLFSTIIISSTIILMVGALFMTAKGGQLWKQSLKFTGLLFLFEVGVLLPFLLFRKIENQAIKGLVGFGAIVIASATILMVGSLFMSMNNGMYGIYALEFTWLLSVFILAMGGTAWLLNKWLGEKEIVKMEEFGIFVLLSTFALITGALFIKQFGAPAAIAYAVLLTVFVGVMSVIAVGLSKWLDTNTLIKMEEFGIFVMLSSLALVSGALFVSQFGVGPVIEYGICLLGFVGLTTLVIALISKFITPDSIVNISMLGTFLLLATGSMILGAWFIDKYGCEPVFKFMGMLLLYVTEATLIMLALNFVAPYIILGIVTAALLGVALMALTASLMLVNALFLLDPGGKKTRDNIATLTSILSIDLMLTFTALGLLAVPIALGSVAAIAIGVSMTILGASFVLINFLMGTHGEEIKESIGKLQEIIGDLKWTYAALGLLSPFIAAGSVAAVAIGVSMTLLSGSLWIMHKLLEGLGFENILTEIGIIGTVITGFGLLSLELIALTIPLTLSLPALGLISLFSLGLSSSISMMYQSVDEMINVGDISDKIALITNNLQSFIDIPDNISFGGILGSGAITKLATIENIVSMVKPMGKAIKTISEAVQSMASLKVPEEWNPDGSVKSYRQLDENDFTLATNNIGKLIYTMANGFAIAWEGDGQTFKGLKVFKNEDEALQQVLGFSKEIGGIISSIAKGISEMAQLKVPEGWNPDGTVKSYRKLSEQDFKDAATNVGIILTHMAGTIGGLYAYGDMLGNIYGGGQNIFDLVSSGSIFTSDKPSPFVNTLTSTLKIGELIGSVAAGIQQMANLTIPIKWDKNGKAIDFKTLTEQDFTDASNNVAKVLTHMIETIAGFYTKGKDGGEFNKGLVPGHNIFDAISSDSWFEDDKPSPFMNTLEATFKVSELIANVASGIKDLAVLQMADEWDPKTGKPIHYVNITQTDFEQAGKNVGTILSTVINAISQLDIDPDEVKEKIEAINPVTTLISGMADSLVKLAQGQVAMVDDKGNITGYRKLDKTDFTNAQNMVKNIIESICGQVKSFADEDKYKDIFKDGNVFESLSKSFDSIGKVISNLTESIVKISEIKLDENKVKNINQLLIDLKNFYASTDVVNTNPENFKEMISNINKFVYDGINPFDKEAFEKGNLLNQTIKKISTTLSLERDNSQKFKKNTDQLANYVKTINTIQVQKVDSLTNLVRELNIFSNKMGNLDKLTEAIAEKLSVVLENLVNKLEESKNTINKADEIQTKRHKLIDDSIKKVKEIMENPINVKVSSDTTQNIDNGLGQGSEEPSESKSPTFSSTSRKYDGEDHSDLSSSSSKGGSGDGGSRDGQGAHGGIQTNITE